MDKEVEVHDKFWRSWRRRKLNTNNSVVVVSNGSSPRLANAAVAAAAPSLGLGFVSCRVSCISQVLWDDLFRNDDDVSIVDAAF